MKVSQPYDGAFSDGGYDTEDTNNDGHSGFAYGWNPGDALPDTSGLSGIGIVFDEWGNEVDDASAWQNTAPDSQPIYAAPPPVSPTIPRDTYSPSTATIPVPESTLDKLLTKVDPGKIMAAVNAWQLSQINIDRARRNMPPLNAGMYGPQIGIGFAGGTGNMLLYGGIALAAVLLLSRK